MDKQIMIYNNRCLFCIRTKNALEKLAGKKVQWVGIDDFNSRKYKIKKEALLKEIHLISNGKIYSGYRAFRHMAKHSIILFPLYAVSFIPIVSFIGEKVYGAIAHHRKRK